MEIHMRLMGLMLIAGTLLIVSGAAGADISIAWNKTFGGPDANDSASSIVPMPGTNGFVFAGSTETFGAGESDGWIMHIDGEGIEIWNRTYGDDQFDHAYSIANTSDRNLIAAGRSTNGSGPGPFSADAFAVQINRSGGELWHSLVGDPESNTSAYSVSEAEDGSILAGSTGKLGALDTDALIVKLHETGDLDWRMAFGQSGAQDAIYSIVRSPEGGYIGAGSTQSYGVTDTDAWIVRVDRDGEEEWNLTYGGTEADVARSLVRTGDGNYLFAGSIVEMGDENALVVKISPEGDTLWHYSYGDAAINESANAVTPTGDGGFLFAGEAGVADSPDTNAWLVKIDSNGQPQWSYMLGGRNPGDRALSVLQVTDTSYLFAGTFNNTIQRTLDDDAWVVKLSEIPGGPAPSVPYRPPPGPKPCPPTCQRCTCSASFEMVPAPDGNESAGGASDAFDVNDSIRLTGHVRTGSGCIDGVTATGWSWDFGDGTAGTGTSVTHAYAGAGTYVVRLVVTLGDGTRCTSSRTVTIVEESEVCNCTADFTFDPENPEVNETVTFTDATTVGTGCNPNVTIASWEWSFGDGESSTDRNPTHNYTANGTYEVTLNVTLSNNITCNATKNVTVAEPTCECTADFTFKDPAPRADDPVSFTDTSTVGAACDPGVTMTNWAWTFGDGGTSTDQNTTHTYTTNGSYEVTLNVTLSNDVTCNATKNVTVTEPTCECVVEFSFDPDAPEVDEPIAFAATGVVASACDPGVAITSWAWTFGDGGLSTLQNPTHIYEANGTYEVVLDVTLSDNTTCNVTKNVTIGQELPPGTCNCTAGFAFAPEAPAVDQEIAFTDTSTMEGNCTHNATWDWDFGDGGTSAEQNPAHAYAANGTYEVTLILSIPDETNCSMTRNVTVGQTASACNCTADFTFTRIPDIGMNDVVFEDRTTVGTVCGAGTTVTAWEWNFGDSSPVDDRQNPTHTYLVGANDSYDATMTVTLSDGTTCNVTKEVDLIIWVVLPPSNVTADFTFAPEAPVVGEEIAFADTTLEGAAGDANVTVTARTWNFGDGGTSAEANPTHAFATAGSYDVTLTVELSDGSTVEATRPVTVAGAAEPTETATATQTATETVTEVETTTATETTSSEETTTTTAQNGTVTISQMVAAAEKTPLSLQRIS